MRGAQKVHGFLRADPGLVGGLPLLSRDVPVLEKVPIPIPIPIPKTVFFRYPIPVPILRYRYFYSLEKAWYRYSGADTSVPILLLI